MKIGDTVIWRNGWSKSKTIIPIGIADCKVVDTGTGPSGEKCVKIELPTFFGERIGENPIWVIAADVEG